MFLAVTGCEALYADLGHFSRAAVQISFSCLAYPCLALTYMGQASWLLHNPSLAADVYYGSIPSPIFWPMLVLATVTSVVASQVRGSAAHTVGYSGANLVWAPHPS